MVLGPACALRFIFHFYRRPETDRLVVLQVDYSPNVYPTYCLGGGYLMSKDMLQGVVGLQYEKRLVPMEDLDVGLLVRILGVKPIDKT